VKGKNHQLFVINAADDTKAEIVPWEGKNGKLNAVSKKPVKTGSEHLIVTVLFPAKTVVYSPDKFPEASFDDGILKISDSKNIDDEITFQMQNGRWILKSVNREKDLSVPDGSDRTLNPFRKGNKTSVNIKKLPAWFMSVSN
jgi:hypothetical protein